jgi:hypothetical protein
LKGAFDAHPARPGHEPPPPHLRQIFCARCSTILDGPKAVSFAVGGRAQKVVCAKCWDEHLEPRLEEVKAQVLAEFGKLPEIEIFDPRAIPDIEEMDRWTPQ